jgi:hypothetical protein
MPRIHLTAAVAIAAAVAVPSGAQGATHHPPRPTPHPGRRPAQYRETNLVSVEGSRSVVIHDTNAPITVDDVPTCMPLDARTVSCAAVRRIELDLGDGPDVAVIATPLPVAIDGGRGNDRYVAHATDAPSRVDFAGGIGLDTANYFFATAGVHVSVDLEAGDGRSGDDDRIRRDVESVLGSEFADVLTGSPRTEQLAGLDGDDQIIGGSGAELLTGGRGNDRIDARDGAPDTIDCGGQELDWAAVDTDAETSITGCAQVVN